MNRWWMAWSIGLLGVVGCQPPAAAPGQEVQVTATEFRFQSSPDTFKAGTPYRFVVKNGGSVAHEWMIMPRGQTGHGSMLAEIKETTLGPGKSATKDFTFSRAGAYEFACHLPGHYESGMVLQITVN